MKSSTGVVMAVRPLTDSHDPYIVFDTNGTVETLELSQNLPVTIRVDMSQKYCTGWYDIATHTNHPCETHATVESKFDSCFVCRKKTDFNPAFYNSLEVSEKQQVYNATPHTVYIAYFGNELAKAGIMADSRGLDRLYEQGALWYAIVGRYGDALEAHRLEERLIARGLKNSVTKKQKEKVLIRGVDTAAEQEKFRELLGTLKYADLDIVPLLDHFFFGEYDKKPITPAKEPLISGNVHGAVGRYLVLRNNDRLYGMHMNDVYGRPLCITNEIQLIESEPVQALLF